MNDDGLTDLMSHYVTADTGIIWGAEEACVSGDTFDGVPFKGCDPVLVLQLELCGIGFELAFLLPPLLWMHRRLRRAARLPS